jgi:hypothetical protein
LVLAKWFFTSFIISATGKLYWYGLKFTFEIWARIIKLLYTTIIK